jgi:hypothetical protein
LPRVPLELDLLAEFYDQRLAVKVARFRIAWGMVGIAIAALDLAVIRAMLRYPEIGFLVLGTLPLVNILVVATLVAKQRPVNRPFLLGFAVSGAMVLALFVALMILDQNQDGPIFYYLSLLYVPMERAGWLDRRYYVRMPLECSVIVGMLTMPQVAFALIGGFFSGRFKITVTRR